MASKGFNKELSHYCEYCAYGKSSEFSNEVLCPKKGITHLKDSCRKYKYDPLKRIPKTVKLDKDYTKEDFSI